MDAQPSAIEKLSHQVTKLLEAYRALQEKNEMLEVENQNLKTELSHKVAVRISALEDELSFKDLQAEDISARIEEIFKS